MDFDFEDGERIVKSLTSKVMSVIGKLRVSPDHVTDTAGLEQTGIIKPFSDDLPFDDEQTFPGLISTRPSSLKRKKEKRKQNSDQTTGKAINSWKSNDRSENSRTLEVTCSNITDHDISTKCEQINDTLNKSCDLLVSSKSPNLSTSYSIHFLSKSRARLLDTGLGLSESLRKIYLNCSVKSPSSSLSASPRFVTVNSLKESPCFQPENFRAGSDTDRTRPMPSSNLSKYSTDSSNCNESNIDSSNCRWLSADNSKLSGCSSDSDVELVKLRYDTTSSSVDTSFDSDLNQPEPPCGTRSLTEEFKHDISFLAKSTYRTSTPDLETAEFVAGSKRRTGGSSVIDSSEKSGSKSCSRDSFLSMTDALALTPRKFFVHGLSPLCRVPVSTRDSHFSSRVRVRRSLTFVSPSKNRSLLPGAADENVPDAYPELQSSGPSFIKTTNPEKRPGIRYSEELILPKFMFRDETEEAVYYLITKYLDNSQCRW